MAHDYKLIVNEEEMTIGPIHNVERTDEDYTFLDEDGSIVAMLKKERLQGIIRLPAKKKKRETVEPDATSTRPPLSDPTTKQLKAPVNDDVPPGVIMPDHDKWQGRSYHFKQNRETKGYEIHSVPCETETGVSSRGSENTRTDDRSEQLVELRYKDITTHGVYDPDSKKVVIEKGSLISRKETHTLQVAANRDGVKLKRREILRKWTEEYNREYDRLSRDIEFSSLTQAACVICGTVLNPKKYWKAVG